MLKHPELALARSAVHNVQFIVSVTDLTEDPRYTFDNINTWYEQAEKLLIDWKAKGIIAEDMQCALPDYKLISGCHPHNASKYDDTTEKLLLELLEDERCAAIGEIGLDYHYDYSPREIQREIFERQLLIAKERGIPVALHLREAHSDGLSILKGVGSLPGGILLHCYNLGPEVLKPFLDLDCKVAFGGPLTFKKSDEVRASAKICPLPSLMTETDAPFMTPEPVRGTVCGPEHSTFVAAKLFEVRGASSKNSEDKNAAELFYQSIFQNAKDFFDSSKQKPQIPTILNENGEAYKITVRSTGEHRKMPSAYAGDVRNSADYYKGRMTNKKKPDLLLISGSPRRKTCESLLGLVKSGVREMGVNTLEFLLSEKRVNPCANCDACLKNGMCVHGGDIVSLGKSGKVGFSDDYLEFKGLLDKTDALAIVAPIFFAGPPAQLKALYDRLQPYWAQIYVLGEPKKPKRPAQLFVVGGGKDPHGYEPLTTISRSALNVAGFYVEKVNNFVGYKAARDLPSKPLETESLKLDSKAKQQLAIYEKQIDEQGGFERRAFEAGKSFARQILSIYE
jgi:TatD DNase family protein